jgi:DNA topoisomerase-2
MLTAGKIRDFADTSTDMKIQIQIKTDDVSQFEKLLTDKIKLSNMHAFNSKGVIHKYNTPNEILGEYCNVRLDLYETRKTTILKTLRSRIPYHENVVRFIHQQCLDTPLPDLRRKTPEECDSLLEGQKFIKIDDSFNYLLNLPIASLTLKHAKKHEKDLADLRGEIEALEKTTSKQMWKNELSHLNV